MAITVNIYYTGSGARAFAGEMTALGIVNEIRAEETGISDRDKAFIRE